MEALCNTSKVKTTMILSERIEALVQLGLSIDHDSNDELYRRAVAENPWFTVSSIIQSIDAIKNSFLDKDKLQNWLNEYNVSDAQTGRKVGLILAGNIPLVGFHDMMSVFLSGHNVIMKLSDKDKLLPTYFIHYLIGMYPELQSTFSIVERLVDYDAVIATGSDSSANIFKKYFNHVPHIVRRNRNGVAVISANDTEKDLSELHHDIFDYFGLGCRNLSKVYLEKGVSPDMVFKVIEPVRDIIHHNKYKNNYDYSYALYLMNQDKFLTNDFMIFRESPDLVSRIACLHFEYYDSRNDLESKLTEVKDKLQCVVSSEPVLDFTHFTFGQAQKPALHDYADGVDTLEFLSQLS
ncbi:acyl-CoA reductase [Saprospiraceae bacterium]|nr:acyl-CoA reductase [Saprospiraceae bacterium]